MKLYNVLFLGDIVGAAGCNAVERYLPKLRSQLNINLVVANVENAAPNGIGLTKVAYEKLVTYGIDVLTSGNNIFYHDEISKTLDEKRSLIRPVNYGKDKPGIGVNIINTPFKRKFVIINLLTQLFMRDKVAHPLHTIKEILKVYSLDSPEILGILVDLHGESNYEKMAIANSLDSQVSCVLGTHTHVPSADSRILPGGTAYQTDVGMCGDYNSVAGINTLHGIEFYIGNRKRSECLAASCEATLCGSYIGINERGLSSFIYPIRLGGILEQTELKMF